jgi:hypothetical protein
MKLQTLSKSLLAAALSFGLVTVPASAFAHGVSKDHRDYRHHERWHHGSYNRWHQRHRPEVVRRDYRRPGYVVTERIYRPSYRDRGLTIIYRDGR